MPDDLDQVSAPDAGVPLVRPAGGDETVADPSQARMALAKEWQEKIRDRKKKLTPDFDQMRENMKFARLGSSEAWAQAKNYRVPIIVRHINQSVSQLYARKPTVSAEASRKVLFKIWDEDPETLKAAIMSIGEAAMTGMPPSPDAVAIVQEVEAVKAEVLLTKRMAETAELVVDYFLRPRPVKRAMKQMVRRAKVCSIGYVELSFEREMQPDPAVTAQIETYTSQLKRIESLAAEAQAGDIEEDSARAEELRLLIKDLQGKQEVIVREGPVLDYPRSTEIIVDADTIQIHGLVGTRWYAREWTKPVGWVKDFFGVDLKKGDFTPYKSDATASSVSGEQGVGGDCCVWRVYDKMLGQTFVLVDGYKDFIKEPAAPEIELERFFPLFTYVPNDVESEDKLYPPSDVEMMRSPSDEINRSRQELVDHRIAARPRWLAAGGALDEKEKKTILDYAAHAIITLKQLMVGQKASELLSPLQHAPVDIKLYDDSPMMRDILSSVGSSEAGMGNPQSNTTATESANAEASRSESIGSSIDELDDMLTEIVQAMTEVSLLYMQRKTVEEIAGINAVWPEGPELRMEAVRKLNLLVKAGSSGRLNAASTLANLERIMPYLIQMPGVNLTPVIRLGAEMLDLPVQQLLAEGAPSATALNAMMAKQMQAPAENPSQGGGKPGGQSPRPGGAQPAMPAGGEGLPTA